MPSSRGDAGRSGDQTSKEGSSPKKGEREQFRDGLYGQKSGTVGRGAYEPVNAGYKAFGETASKGASDVYNRVNDTGLFGTKATDSNIHRASVEESKPWGQSDKTSFASRTAGTMLPIEMRDAATRAGSDFETGKNTEPGHPDSPPANPFGGGAYPEK